ncbi:UNVERIFIED_CONTAM: LytTR family two component transcriptional regulator [Williamsia faeni]
MTQTTKDSAPTRRPALTVLAVDDEWPALDELAYLLRAEDAVAEVLTAGDATSALRLIKDRPDSIDAVFLDINMPGLDGLELAGVLAAFANPPAVVFVTAHDDRAVAAFDLGAVDYLLKPLRAQRLAEAVRRVVEQRETPEVEVTAEVGGVTGTDEVIPVEMSGATTLVNRSDVSWVEAEGDYTRLHTPTGSHLVRIPISALESRWAQAGFLRVHRSYLVSLALVTGIRTVGSGMVVQLRPEPNAAVVELPVSRRHTRELKDRLVRSPKQERTTR